MKFQFRKEENVTEYGEYSIVQYCVSQKVADQNIYRIDADLSQYNHFLM